MMDADETRVMAELAARVDTLEMELSRLRTVARAVLNYSVLNRNHELRRAAGAALGMAVPMDDEERETRMDIAARSLQKDRS